MASHRIRRRASSNPAPQAPGPTPGGTADLLGGLSAGQRAEVTGAIRSAERLLRLAPAPPAG